MECKSLSAIPALFSLFETIVMDEVPSQLHPAEQRRLVFSWPLITEMLSTGEPTGIAAPQHDESHLINASRNYETIFFPSHCHLFLFFFPKVKLILIAAPLLSAGPHKSHYDDCSQGNNYSQDVKVRRSCGWSGWLVATTAIILVAPFVELALELLQFDTIPSFLFFSLGAFLLLFQLSTKKFQGLSSRPRAIEAQQHNIISSRLYLPFLLFLLATNFIARNGRLLGKATAGHRLLNPPARAGHMNGRRAFRIAGARTRMTI